MFEKRIKITLLFSRIKLGKEVNEKINCDKRAFFSFDKFL